MLSFNITKIHFSRKLAEIIISTCLKSIPSTLLTTITTTTTMIITTTTIITTTITTTTITWVDPGQIVFMRK